MNKIKSLSGKQMLIIAGILIVGGQLVLPVFARFITGVIGCVFLFIGHNRIKG